MAEHTPTPWLVSARAHFRIVAEWGDTVATVGSDSGLRDQWEANAAFIVKAVNNHDALVEALRPFAWYFDVNDCADWPDHGNAIEVPIRDLKRAFDAFKSLGLKVSPVSGDVGGSR